MAGLLAAETAALNLTPIPHKKQVEGGVSDEIAFRNGESLVTYSPPGQWAASGGGSRVVFRPGPAEAEAVFESRRKPDVTAFDPDVAKALKAGLQASLPKESTNLEWAEDEANPLFMNRHPTYRVTLSYSSYAQRFTTTMIVCNFAQQQMRFTLTTRESDFKKVYEDFRRSLYTFSGLE